MSRFSCLICALSLLSSSALADEAIKGRSELNWRMGHERSILMTEFWVPFMQDTARGNVLYGSLRMMGDDQDNREGNLGIGYRQLVEGKNFNGVAGVHAWLDRRITQRGSTFHQATFGAEWLGENLDMRLNGYLPLSNETTYSTPHSGAQDVSLVGTGLVVSTDGSLIEQPQHGFDLELGLELGQHFDVIKNNTDSVRLYGGGYYFNGDLTEDVAGLRTRFTAGITEDVQIGARFQRDDERGSQGFLEATLRFPFGQKKSYRDEGVRARLDESPERDIDIVTAVQVTNTGGTVAVLNTTTGMAQEVLSVDNTAAGGGDGSTNNPFNTLADAQAAASAHTIIYVNEGDGTATNQDQGITLSQDGQQLIGSGVDFVYDSGRFSTANGASPSSIVIKPATTAPVIANINVNGDGVTITADDVVVAGIDANGSARDGVVVAADGAGASAQNVTISNVTARNNRMGVYIHGTNSGSVSAKVQSTIATGNSQHGIAVYDDTSATFEADLGGGAMGSLGLNVLASNTLEDLAVEYDGRTLAAQNNWWGQATGADTDTPDIGIGPQIYYGAPINDGLVGHWTFDNEWTTNTTAYDRSGNGNDGSLNGGLSLSDQVTGQHRQALNFDGFDDFFDGGRDSTLEDAFDSTAYTLLVSANSTDTNPLSRLGGIRDSSSGAHIILYNFSSIGRIRFYEGHAGASSALGSVASGLNDGAWHQFAGQRDGATQILYVDGGFDGSKTRVTGTLGSENFFLGRDSASNNSADYFQGAIDDTRIYDRVLDASEIAELNRMDASSVVDTSNFLTSSP